MRIKYKVGDRFLFTSWDGTQEHFILAQIEPRKFILICLEDGGRWSDWVNCHSDRGVTATEWKLVASGTVGVKKKDVLFIGQFVKIPS